MFTTLAHFTAGILLAEVIPRILEHVQCFLSSESQSIGLSLIESKSVSQFWLTIIEVIKDPYGVERFSEELLRQLATKDVNDTEAYWMLWMLFHRTMKHLTAVRSVNMYALAIFLNSSEYAFMLVSYNFYLH